MQKLYSRIAGVITFSLLTVSVSAQTWKTGGNIPCPGLDCVDATNNILGLQANVPLRFSIATTEHMRLTSQGRLGIGLTAPQNRLHLHERNNNNIFSQWTNDQTGSSDRNGLIVGIRPGTINNLPFAEVNQQEDAPIVFSTDKTERMRIMGIA